MTLAKKKILIVDDHPIILNGLKTLFNQVGSVELVGTAQNGALALKLIHKLPIDILVTDIQMPKMDGFELIEVVKKNYPKIKIIVLSMFEDEWRIKKLLDLGVDSILTKSVNEIELKKTITAIEMGEKYYDDHTKDIVLKVMIEKDANPKSMSIDTLFSKREKEVMDLILKGKTSKDISQIINKSLSTVETHRRNMFAKADVKNVTSLVQFCYDQGYVRKG